MWPEGCSPYSRGHLKLTAIGVTIRFITVIITVLSSITFIWLIDTFAGATTKSDGANEIRWEFLFFLLNSIVSRSLTEKLHFDRRYSVVRQIRPYSLHVRHTNKRCKCKIHRYIGNDSLHILSVCDLFSHKFISYNFIADIMMMLFTFLFVSLILLNYGSMLSTDIFYRVFHWKMMHLNCARIFYH